MEHKSATFLVNARVAAMSYDELMEALEKEDIEVTQAVVERIQFFSDIASEELKEGRDYLPALTPQADTPPLDMVAMEVVVEVMDEELEDA